MNILFTCSGRRNYLLHYFKTIKGVRIVACDSSSNAPTLYSADEFFLMPDVYDPNYTKILMKEVKARNIDVIIPLNDLELPILARCKKEFENEGIRILISDKFVVDLCFDKLMTFSFTTSLPLKKIPTFTSVEEALKYKSNHKKCDFVIKPRWGSASFGIEFPKNEEELRFLFKSIKEKIEGSLFSKSNNHDPENCILIQKKITGQEYGMDIINNLKAEFETTLQRKKISMRAGETEKAETVYINRLMVIGKIISERLKHIGILDCDLFIEDENVYLLEMNPRFGGGYPFMHFAGTDLPYALVEWLNGRDTPSGCLNYRIGAKSAKVDMLVGINN